MDWQGIVGRNFTAGEFATYVEQLPLGDWRPRFVVLHNTGSPRLSQWHSVPGASRMANLEHYYRDEQGWTAGPHLFVADDFIWAFTPLSVRGVHAPSWNDVSWGVEMVGDYSAEPFGDGVRSNTIAALAALHRKAGLDPATLRLHKEDPRTTHRDCPGVHVGKADIVAAIAAALKEES